MRARIGAGPNDLRANQRRLKLELAAELSPRRQRHRPRNRQQLSKTSLAAPLNSYTSQDDVTTQTLIDFRQPLFN